MDTCGRLPFVEPGGPEPQQSFFARRRTGMPKPRTAFSEKRMNRASA